MWKGEVFFRFSVCFGLRDWNLGFLVFQFNLKVNFHLYLSDFDELTVEYFLDLVGFV